MKAGTPLLSTDLPERKRIIEQYNTGLIVKDLNPTTLADALSRMMTDEEAYCQWKEGCAAAARDLCWENEEKVLEQIYLSL